ncbi:MAG TPA: IS481 family transposase [Jatrophihabitans sp.]|nr:IS481 family transposase [Jatrophihabitans sp.]
MAWKVTAMDVRMAAALARGIDDVAAFCRAQNISRETYYKWKRRFEREGLDGLRDRSRRPNSVPNATPAGIEDAIVRARKELADAGQFNGPFSIADRLAAQGVSPVPSRATIARILARRGLVRPQPRKRPRSSYRRFQAGRPNEMWQSDWTEWRLVNQDGSLRPAAIAGTLDDHSRLLVGLRAEAGDGTGELVWAVMAAAIGTYGVPMSSLTDNGLCYSTKHRTDHRPAHFEANLAALGCQSIASTPYHPQTCGKIERLWQTLKKWLRARERAHGPYRTLAALNRDLAIFAEHYNTRRGHRALHGRTPATVYAATVKARPADRPLPSQVQTYRSRVSTGGTISVSGPPGAVAKQLRVHLGGRYKQLPVTVLQDGIRVAVFSGNELIRALDLDPTKIYQPLHP